MSTRGRRSLENVGLNPAMIHLLDISRLRRELEARGLDTKGNKLILADRLDEAVHLGKSPNLLVPSSQKGAVINSPAKSNKKEKTAEVITLKSPTQNSKKALKEEEEGAVVAKFLPDELAVSSKSVGRPKKAIIEKVAPTSNKTTPKRKTLKEEKEREAVVKYLPNKSEISSRNVDRSKKASNEEEPIFINNKPTRKRKVNEKEQREDETPAKLFKFVWATEAPIQAVKRLDSSISPTPEISTSTIPEVPTSAISDVSTSPIADVSTSTIAVASTSLIAEVSTSTIVSLPSPNLVDSSATPLILGTTVTTTASVDTNSKILQKNIPTKTTAPPESLSTIILPDSTISSSNITSAAPVSSSKSVDSSVKSLPLRKKISTAGKTSQLPQRVIAGGIDLLDNIFSEQDRLLAEKYKSDQEKAMEKHLFELQKRRNTFAGRNTSIEKQSQRSVDSSSGQHSIIPTTDASPTTIDDDSEYLPPVFSINTRDPLNLRSVEPLPALSWGELDGTMACTTTAEMQDECKSHSGPEGSQSPLHTSSHSPNMLMLSPPPPPPAYLPPPPPPPRNRSKSSQKNEASKISELLKNPKAMIQRAKDVSKRINEDECKAHSGSEGSQSPLYTSSHSPNMLMLSPPPPPSAYLPPPPPPPRNRSKSSQKNEASEVSELLNDDKETQRKGEEVSEILDLLKDPKNDKDDKEMQSEGEEASKISELLKDSNDDKDKKETQSVGEEVSEISELLKDPKALIQRATDVSKRINEDECMEHSGSEGSQSPLYTSSHSPNMLMLSPPPPPPAYLPPPPPPPRNRSKSSQKNEASKISELLKDSKDDKETQSEGEQPSKNSDLLKDSKDDKDDKETQSEGEGASKISELLKDPKDDKDDKETHSEGGEASKNSDLLKDSKDDKDDKETQSEGEGASKISELLKDSKDDKDDKETHSEGEEASKNSDLLKDSKDHKDDKETHSEGEEASKISELLKDPKALIQRATDVLKRINESEVDTDADTSHARYDQLELDATDYVLEEEEKPLPDFHGEPVPDDEDDDDALFEIAAGLRPAGKKRDLVPTAADDEPLPDDEFIELDYYNADMNIKASTNNKWLIDPDNQDGFALMWGGVKSNYGILVSNSFGMEQNADVTINSNVENCDDTTLESMDTEDASTVSATRPVTMETPIFSTATAGLLPKKVAFQIKIFEFLSLKHVPFEELEPHDVRIGWSAASNSNMLGESSQSYMFCSNARKANGNVFVDYGDPFHVNDVITTVLDFEKREIRYYKNCENLGVAFTNVDFPVGTVVFPHIATKNCKVLVNFGYDDLPDTENADDWNLPDEEVPSYDENGRPLTNSGVIADELDEEEYDGAIMIGLLQRRSGLLVPSRRPPPDKAHCTVIAMVGLPGVGKTTWVKQYLFDHPEEHWILFNTDTILNAMTVNGISRRRVHQGRWDMVMGLTAKALNRSLQMACRRRHNYILDQTNVSREARKKKLTQFADFQRKCVVILPSDEELERRLLRQSRQEGSAGQIPVEAMLELKGSFSIPCTETEPVEDVLFIEPPMSRLNEAIEQVKRYNEEGRPWIRKPYTTQKPESVISDCRNDMSNPWVSNQQQSQTTHRHSHNSTF